MPKNKWKDISDIELIQLHVNIHKDWNARSHTDVKQRKVFEQKHREIANELDARRKKRREEKNYG